MMAGTVVLSSCSKGEEYSYSPEKAQVAKRTSGFDVKILAYDPLVSPERVVIKVKVATSCKIWPQLNLMVII